MEGSARSSGVLLVAKPAGVTSHDVVERIRRSPLAAGARVGHAGTLDPFATGLLVMLVGRATRAQRFFTALPKTYRVQARFGISSDTGDPTGTLTETGARVDEETLSTALPNLVGETRQRVPLTSAVKMGGERLYRKARRGEQFETPVRLVQVSRLELLGFDQRSQQAELELDCSRGTYVRQLVMDLGEICGTGAHCQTLERLAVGPFKLEDADEDRLIPLAQALDFLPQRELAAEEARIARHGQAVAGGSDESLAASTIVRLTLDGELVAIAERRDGVLKPVTVLSH
jgi:tRNA pseudouridine55 synthase